MKENKYDQESFFERYSQMDRSKKGLSAAGEWETLKSILPDFKNKRVLDIGCGYGWHCIYAMEQGAASAVGVDISRKMLEVAKSKTDFTQIEYICSAIEDIEFEEESFDLVLSSLALHYVAHIDVVLKKVHTCLKKGASFAFSVEHPIFTAQGTQDWYRYKSGEILHFPVDNYFCEGKRVANFLGEEVVKYHKTLTTYINGLLCHGFEIQHVIEPKPSQEMLDFAPQMKDELRRPMMLIISARKK